MIPATSSPIFYKMNMFKTSLKSGCTLWGLVRKRSKAVQERSSSPEGLIKHCWGHRQLPCWALLHIAKLLHKLVYIYCSYKALSQKRHLSQIPAHRQELQGTISAHTPGKQETQPQAEAGPAFFHLAGVCSPIPSDPILDF